MGMTIISQFFLIIPLFIFYDYVVYYKSKIIVKYVVYYNLRLKTKSTIEI